VWQIQARLELRQCHRRLLGRLSHRLQDEARMCRGI
jgi:hypothetical protein